MPKKGECKVPDTEIERCIRDGMTYTQMLQALSMHDSGPSWRRVDRISKRIGVPMRRFYQDRVLGQENTEAIDRFQSHLREHARKHFECQDGVILSGSDAHYWPGVTSTAHRALLKLAKDLKPRAVIMNGDGLDGASISRWPRIGWDSKPKMADELTAVTKALTEIEDASGTRNLYWPCGNHDARFETFLASRTPELQGIPGFRLKDHFPFWTPCWSVWVNNEVVFKHRFKGGIHATHNNTMWAGKTMVNGHLHSQKVAPFSDYNGTRWGVDLGCIAPVYGPQFADYTEDNPVNWRSGFAVFTFWRGKLLDPELVRVLDEEAGQVVFRGQVITV